MLLPHKFYIYYQDNPTQLSMGGRRGGGYTKDLVDERIGTTIKFNVCMQPLAVGGPMQYRPTCTCSSNYRLSLLTQ